MLIPFLVIVILLLILHRLLYPSRQPTPFKLAVHKPSALDKLLSEAFEHVTEGTTASRVVVLYGTEYGFAKEVALKLASALAQAGLAPRVVNVRHYRVLDLTKEKFLAFVCSTTGDGVPPNDATELRDALVKRDVVMPLTCRFGVLALGDRAYPHFCRAGIAFDELLGEGRLIDRVDIDQEDWTEIDDWIERFVDKVEKEGEEEEEDDYLRAAMVKYAEVMESREVRYSRNEPYMAMLDKMEVLTGPKVKEGEKEVIRVEFETEGMEYQVGDAVGVVPKNNSEEVTRLLLCVACNGDEQVYVADQGQSVGLEAALTDWLDVHKVKPELVSTLGGMATDESERKLAERVVGKDGVTEWGKTYLDNRHLIDVLSDFVSASMGASQLASLLRPLHARYYSISSSSVVSPKRIAATVDVLRYSMNNVDREGVASTFLRDRCVVGRSKVGIFISRNDNFRLPVEGDTDVVMIGPGTGVAPFIGFVEERVAQEATGLNWLFFGCRFEEQDFLYRERLRGYEQDEKLRLSTAFSRVGKDKVYVQHRMEEVGEELWNVIDNGAHLYVCGDGRNMAEDVEKCLQSVIQKWGNKGAEEASTYLQQLAQEQRYQRDVWVA